MAAKEDYVVWYEIPNMFGVNYSISACGRVLSKSRLVDRVWKNTIITQRAGGKELKCTIGLNGYRVCTLLLNGVQKKFYVHELVALTFLGERPKGTHICHGDGNPLNNRYTNLRYDSPEGNASDRVLHGTDAKGIKNPMNKYSEETIAHMKFLLITERQCDVARLMGLPSSTVRSVKQGKQWRNVKPAYNENFIKDSMTTKPVVTTVNG